MPPRQKRSPVSPTLQAFGRQFRRHRDALGLSQDRAGQRAQVTGQYIGQVEAGRTRCTREFTETMDREFKVNGSLLDLWDDLVQNAAFPTWFDWPSVEEEAIMLQSYQPLLVHGLLQVPTYATAVLRGNQRSVDARFSRQAILTRDEPPPPAFSLLLDEVALYRQVGSPETMREQLTFLIEVNARENTQVQIVPINGEHLGHYGAFTLATLPDMSEVAYVENAARGFTMSDQEDLAAITKALLEIRSHALPVGMSMDFIRRTVEEKWS